MPNAGIAVRCLIAVGAVTALTGCPCFGPGVPAQLTPFADEPGYNLTGPFDLEGQLTLGMEGMWELNASFLFPTSGYVVAEPEVIVRESFPEQVTFLLRVTPPPPDAVVLQVITEVPVQAVVEVDVNATFEVLVETACFRATGRKTQRMANNTDTLSSLGNRATRFGDDLVADLTGHANPSRTRVLFVCNGNSCRSQMAEGWGARARRRYHRPALRRHRPARPQPHRRTGDVREERRHPRLSIQAHPGRGHPAIRLHHQPVPDRVGPVPSVSRDEHGLPPPVRRSVRTRRQLPHRRRSHRPLPPRLRRDPRVRRIPTDHPAAAGDSDLDLPSQTQVDSHFILSGG